MSEIKPITDHGQETARYRCDQCNHDVSIDIFDVFAANFNVYCPVCGAGPDHLTYKEFE